MSLTKRLTIRNKLLTGLVVVLAISAVLITNTLIGLYSYRSSIKAVDSQMKVLAQAKLLWDQVTSLGNTSSFNQSGVGDQRDLFSHIDDAERELKRFRNRVRSSDQYRTPDKGELAVHERIKEKLGEIRQFARRVSVLPDQPFELNLSTDSEFQAHIHELGMLAASLHDPIALRMKDLVEDAESAYHMNLVIGWSTGLLTLVLLLILVRLTNYWILRPIRKLHTSVQLVGGGDLSHRIRLRTGDEMQELASSFNDMTTQLQKILEDLEQQVEDRSRELVRSEHLASVGFLAAGVAHEINNPLASISLCAEAITARMHKTSEQEQPELEDILRYLSMIENESFRCKGITEKLLDFARMREPIRKSTAIHELISDVRDVVQHLGTYKEKKIEISGSSSIMAEVNGQEIKQVILNLVVNALDSMESNGTLLIETRTSGTFAEISFVDDGVGMTHDVLENIFEPFFTRKKTGKGTGLGLSISHRIVTDHAGQIEASSQGTGHGSRFIVRLPMKQAQPQQEQFSAKIAA